MEKDDRGAGKVCFGGELENVDAVVGSIGEPAVAEWGAYGTKDVGFCAGEMVAVGWAEDAEKETLGF